jgi:hypothetical protein
MIPMIAFLFGVMGLAIGAFVAIDSLVVIFPQALYILM